MMCIRSHTRMSRSSGEHTLTPSGRLVLLVAGSVLLLSTAMGQIAVIGGLSQDREATPGEVYDGAITVKNDTDAEQEVKIYQRDYFFASDGSNVYGDPGRMARSNARWVTFAPATIVLPAKGSATVKYTVTVPRDSVTAPLVGSFWSMLMVESIPEGSPESSVKGKGGTKLGLRQNIRYAVQIATHLRNAGTKMVRFFNVKLVKGEDGERLLQVDVENTGEAYLRPDVTVELFGADGESRGKLPGGKYRMYPGTSVRHLIKVNDLPPGTYKALVVVDAGGPDVFGAQYTLQF
jgi:hypothetical protein